MQKWCQKCNNSIFEIKNLRFDVKIKSENIEVIIPSYACKNCGNVLMDDEQVNKLRKSAANNYRKIKGLLTAENIIAYREKLGLSQVGFAQFLNVGEASIKRWETYYIQDESQDDHIRLKCDPLYSESNYFYLQEKYKDFDIYTGNRAFSPFLVGQVSRYFELNSTKFITHLRKLHFYADFLHFKRYNRCITGMRYIPMKTGPSPCNYDQLTCFIQRMKLDAPKSECLDDNEKETVEDICSLFLQDDGDKICNMSVREKGFLETQDTAFISYEYAKDLLI